LADHDHAARVALKDPDREIGLMGQVELVREDHRAPVLVNQNGLFGDHELAVMDCKVHLNSSLGVCIRPSGTDATRLKQGGPALDGDLDVNLCRNLRDATAAWPAARSAGEHSSRPQPARRHRMTGAGDAKHEIRSEISAAVLR
jgi:hypothetical protein